MQQIAKRGYQHNEYDDDDGGIRLYVQHENPGKEAEANWLPSPDSSFQVILRLYWPRESVISGEWKQPQLLNVSK